MARPRDCQGGVAQSTAFLEKSAKEKEKLRTKMARQLKIDMETLLEEEIHPDLILLLPGEKVPVHSAILKARAPFFFQDLLGSPLKSKKRLDSLDSCQVKFLLKQIYTADDLTEEANLVKQWVAAGLQAKRPTSGRDKNANTMRFQSPTQSSIARKRAGSNSPSRQRKDSGDSRSSSPRGQSTKGQTTSKGHGRSPPKDLSTSTTSSEGESRQPKKKRLLSDATTPDDVELDFPVDDEAGKEGSTKDEPALQPCSPLGDSLLDMFRLGTGSDVTLVVDGKKMRAHQCILCARSPYFAAMLGGSWKESNTQEIRLEGVSSTVVQQSLLYMYGGVISLIKGCSLVEVISAADMYGIEGLKEVASLILRMEYCHFFHKPCGGCLGGVPDAIALAYSFGLEELLERALRWSGRHLARLWSSKTFALLPQEVLDRCCDAVIQELSSENVIDMATECDKLMGSLPQVHWSEPVVAMATKLMDGCIEHVRNNFAKIVITEKFMSMGMTMALGLSFLEDVFGRALLTMPTERACESYNACRKLMERCQDENCSWNEDFRHLVRALTQKCEQFLTMYINQVVDTAEWNLFAPDMQKQIKDGAWFVSVGESRRVRAPPVLPSSRPRLEGGDIGSRQHNIPVRQSTNRANRSSASPNSGSSGGCSSGLPLPSGRGRGGEAGVTRRQPPTGGARPKSTGSIGLKSSGASSKLPGPSKSLQENLKTRAGSAPDRNGHHISRGHSHSPTLSRHADLKKNETGGEEICSQAQDPSCSGQHGTKVKAVNKSSQAEGFVKVQSRAESKIATVNTNTSKQTAVTGQSKETKEKSTTGGLGPSLHEKNKASKLPKQEHRNGAHPCVEGSKKNGSSHLGRERGNSLRAEGSRKRENTKNLAGNGQQKILRKEPTVFSGANSQLPKCVGSHSSSSEEAMDTAVTPPGSPPATNVPSQIPRSRPRPKSQTWDSTAQEHEQVKRSSSAPAPLLKSESRARSMLPVRGKVFTGTKEPIDVEAGKMIEVELGKGHRETVLTNLALKNIKRLEGVDGGNHSDGVIDLEEERSLSPCSNIAVRDSTSTGFDMSPSDMESESGFDASDVFSMDGEILEVEEVPECMSPRSLPWEQRLSGNDDGYVSMKPNSEESLPETDLLEAQYEETVNSLGGFLFHVDLLPPAMEVYFMQP